MKSIGFRTNFLESATASKLRAEYGTPLFVYSKQALITQSKTILNIPAPYGLTVRYAMKANPNPSVLSTFLEQGIKIDASTGYEAELALANGFKGDDILLTSQQLPKNLKELVEKGVQFNATSLHQLKVYGELFPSTNVSVRLNPGIGSGHSAKATTGGLASSFGIWNDYIPQIHEIANQHSLTIKRVHTHIGSGTDPEVWQKVARMSIECIKLFPDATIVDLGGGFKVARMDHEELADITKVGKAISAEISRFYKDTGRKLKLELEPGTFLVANAGVLLSSVEDLVDTGDAGYNFLKLDTGMNDILRPTLYGAQHPIYIVKNNSKTEDYVVVGHNCESGDILTPAPGEPEILSTRQLSKAEIGDLVLIGGVGAYCASMSARGYNSYPETKQIMVQDD